MLHWAEECRATGQHRFAAVSHTSEPAQKLALHTGRTTVELPSGNLLAFIGGGIFDRQWRQTVHHRVDIQSTYLHLTLKLVAGFAIEARAVMA